MYRYFIGYKVTFWSCTSFIAKYFTKLVLGSYIFRLSIVAIIAVLQYYKGNSSLSQVGK
jgi:hypothetical protein